MKCFQSTGCCFPSFPCSPCSPCFPNSLLLLSKMARFYNLWSPGFTWVNPSGYLAAPEIIILHILMIIYTGEKCWYYFLSVWSTRRAAKSDLKIFWLRYPSKFWIWTFLGCIFITDLLHPLGRHITIPTSRPNRNLCPQLQDTMFSESLVQNRVSNATVAMNNTVQTVLQYNMWTVTISSLQV